MIFRHVDSPSAKILVVQVLPIQKITVAGREMIIDWRYYYRG